MRIPRWLVVTLLSLSALVLLAVPAWWWVTWPERTAREFVNFMAVGQVNEADKMQRKPIGSPIDLWSVMET